MGAGHECIGEFMANGPTLSINVENKIKKGKILRKGCEGNGGSPLQSLINGRWKLEAIFYSGPDCRKRKPKTRLMIFGFIRDPRYRKWLEQFLQIDDDSNPVLESDEDL